MQRQLLPPAIALDGLSIGISHTSSPYSSTATTTRRGRKLKIFKKEPDPTTLSYYIGGPDYDFLVAAKEIFLAEAFAAGDIFFLNESLYDQDFQHYVNSAIIQARRVALCRFPNFYCQYS